MACANFKRENIMSITPEFQFSQSSLHDYEECVRRFQLRYIDRLAWPAAEVQPALEHERYIQQGETFHRLVQQHILGIPADEIVVRGDELRSWWQNYLAYPPANLPMTRYPEILLSAKIAGHHLVAKYDLLAIEAGQRAVIVDWKTTRKRPKTQWLTRNIQTRVYRYVLVRSGVMGHAFIPEQVEMVYWFANAPTEPEILPYAASQFQDDEAYLMRLIEQIKGQTDFPKTEHEGICRFCPYRGLCGRAEKAGTVEDMIDWLERDEDVFTLLNTKLEMEF
jgi:CRISPR/Cas system-associated exonuclease Cas4 (RecB family)